MREKFKNNFVIIFLTIVSIVALATAMVSSIDNPLSTEDGIIKIELINEYDEVVDERRIAFSKGETLIKVLQRTYLLNYEYYAEYGVFLKTVGELDTKNKTNSYISVYINDVYWLEGVSSIKLKDDLKITFKLEYYTLE